MIRTRATGTYKIPGLINAVVLLLQLSLLTLAFYAAARASGWLAIAGLSLAFGILMNSVYSVIHEAEHRMLFAIPWLNDLSGVFMALFFPAPFHLLRQGHLGHHMRNRSDDVAFDLYFEG